MEKCICCTIAEELSGKIEHNNAETTPSDFPRHLSEGQEVDSFPPIDTPVEVKGDDACRRVPPRGGTSEEERVASTRVRTCEIRRSRAIRNLARGRPRVSARESVVVTTTLILGYLHTIRRRPVHREAVSEGEEREHVRGGPFFLASSRDECGRGRWARFGGTLGTLLSRGWNENRKGWNFFTEEGRGGEIYGPGCS